ncbi:copper transporter [Corallococcus sp. CA041A]|uniref:copper transporter n=1 Tax=Corallococcus sp. CA041A TaxID=2316727 RepID=UPI000EA14FCF|nr:copper transporter [Corallococcus sp. CA041A]RKH24375.1 copper transporter [Corallococcus sp. CA041A]
MPPSSRRIVVLTVAAVLVGVTQLACSKEPTAAKAPEADEHRGHGYTALVDDGHVVNGKLMLEMSVTEKGFEPSSGVLLQKNQPVTLLVTRRTEATCATSLVLADYGIDAKLPLNTLVEIAFTPRQSGTLHYGCPTGETTGRFFVQ